MSSALAMVLAAGMVIGDGPGKASGEQKTPKPLNLRGVWEGDFFWQLEPKKTCKVEVIDDNFRVYDKEQTLINFKKTESTKGMFAAKEHWGILLRGSYEQEDNRVLIRITSAEDTFSRTKNTYEKPILIKLRRIKRPSMPKAAD